jgi:hypothetical protein
MKPLYSGPVAQGGLQLGITACKMLESAWRVQKDKR